MGGLAWLVGCMGIWVPAGVWGFAVYLGSWGFNRGGHEIEEGVMKGESVRGGVDGMYERGGRDEGREG